MVQLKNHLPHREDVNSIGLDVHKGAIAVAVLNGADLRRQVYEIATTATSLALPRYAPCRAHPNKTGTRIECPSAAARISEVSDPSFMK